MAVVDFAELKLTDEQRVEVKRFTGQMLQFGCALLPVMSQADVEAEIFAALRPAWISACRGNKQLEDAYAKVVMAVEQVLEPLFAAGRIVERATR
jgi:hypothetical protein